MPPAWSNLSQQQQFFFFDLLIDAMSSSATMARSRYTGLSHLAAARLAGVVPSPAPATTHDPRHQRLGALGPRRGASNFDHDSMAARKSVMSPSSAPQLRRLYQHARKVIWTQRHPTASSTATMDTSGPTTPSGAGYSFTVPAAPRPDASHLSRRLLRRRNAYRDFIRRIGHPLSIPISGSSISPTW